MAISKVGLMGCGNIAPAYIRGCGSFENVEIIACADIDVERAKKFGEEYGIAGMSVDELLNHPDVDIIINLTVPKVHADVSLAIIEAGKHVHTEKPLALEREDGQKILQAAKEKGVLVGCAPDTFMGGGLQTVRKLIEDGAIGRPVAAMAAFAGHGPEKWHPNPAFFYEIGGGPLLDIGPYPITAMVSFFGPVKRVSASAQKSFEERIAGNGDRLPVEVSTHVSATLDFHSGTVATLITSFDMWKHNLPNIEIYGETGSIRCPDPNRFDGEVKLWTTETEEWTDVPLTHSAEVGRGIGVSDLAYAIQNSRPHRVSGDLGLHVLDIMQAIEESSAQGKHIEIGSTLVQPAPLPVDLPQGQLDA